MLCAIQQKGPEMKNDNQKKPAFSARLTVVAIVAVVAVVYVNVSRELPEKVVIHVRDASDGSQAIIEYTRIKKFKWLEGGGLEIKAYERYLDTTDLQGKWNPTNREPVPEEWASLRHRVYLASELINVDIKEE